MMLVLGRSKELGEVTSAMIEVASVVTDYKDTWRIEANHHFVRVKFKRLRDSQKFNALFPLLKVEMAARLCDEQKFAHAMKG